MKPHGGLWCEVNRKLRDVKEELIVAWYSERWRLFQAQRVVLIQVWGPYAFSPIDQSSRYDLRDNTEYQCREGACKRDTFKCV